MAESAARRSKWPLGYITLSFPFLIQLALGDQCGPLGYDVKDLLSPNYWFVDLNATDCAKIPRISGSEKGAVKPGSDNCRLYMTLCEAMSLQCSGTVCLRYINTEDYVLLLGKADRDPFTEAAQSFVTNYVGMELCPTESSTLVRTRIAFICNKTAMWNTTEVHFYHGAKAPTPTKLNFDAKSCQLSMEFHYSGACPSSRPGDAPAKTMSVGTIILILFFPGLLLYFLIGMLINRMAGRQGKEIIPHAGFWLDLPDLIMDGFIFTMAMVTCRASEPHMKYENM